MVISCLEGDKSSREVRLFERDIPIIIYSETTNPAEHSLSYWIHHTPYLGVARMLEKLAEVFMSLSFQRRLLQSERDFLDSPLSLHHLGMEVLGSFQLTTG